MKAAPLMNNRSPSALDNSAQTMGQHFVRRMALLLVGLLLAGGLFLVMAWLIQPKNQVQAEQSGAITLLRIDKQQSDIEREKPPEPPVKVEPPPPPPPPMVAAQANSVQSVVMDMPSVQLASLQLAGLEMAQVQTNPQAAVPNIAAQALSREADVVAEGRTRYPPAAQRRKISGFVTFEFYVDAKGRAQEIKLIASEPEGIFDSAGLTQLQSTIFQPELADGKAVAVRFTRTLRFKP